MKKRSMRFRWHATKHLAHHDHELQSALIGDAIKNPVGIFARLQYAFVSQDTQVLGDIALRGTDGLNNVLHTDLVRPQNTKNLQAQRVRNRLERPCGGFNLFLVFDQVGQGWIHRRRANPGGRKESFTMYKIVLLRHGESVWNQENRFTGWTDVGLTAKGLGEAKAAGQLLAAQGYSFDIAYTSVLSRAIKTLWTVLEEMDRLWIPVQHSWRLNERHYGALQGLDKAETAAKFGDAQVLIWRRAYDTPPPELDVNDERLLAQNRNPRYAGLSATDLPRTECLKDTVARVLPFWNDTIAPTIKSGKQVLIAAHGNSIRAMIKYLDNVSDDAIVGLNIPTAQPLVYELDADLKPIKHYYLGDPEAIAAALQAVANQGKAKA